MSNHENDSFSIAVNQRVFHAEYGMIEIIPKRDGDLVFTLDGFNVCLQ